MIKLDVKAMLMDKKDTPCLLLQDSERRKVLPMWIGSFEATVITYTINNKKFPRPLTHDLFLDMLSKFGSGLHKVVINDLKEGTYHAKVYIKGMHNRGLKKIDARPSDSIALALKRDAPIYIAEELFEENSIPSPIEKERERERFQYFLDEELDMKDFKNFDEED